MPESNSQPTSPAPASLRIASSSRPWILAAVMATLFITALEGSIVATAMPPIVGELGGFDLFSWVFTSYMLAQAITVPTYGRLADLYGRKRMLFIGISLFLIGSVLCGLAWNMVSLIVFRTVQGIGAGGLLPIAITIVGDIYTPTERARVQGYISSVWSVAAIIGPAIGAFLVSHASWPLVFWINVPIGLVAAGLLAFALHENIQVRVHRIDYVGSLLMTLGTFLVLFAFVQATALSWSTIALLVGSGIAVLIAMVAYERRTPEPMIPLALWRQRIIAGGGVACAAIGAIVIGASVFLSIYVQMVMGQSPLAAGWVLTAVSCSWVFGSISGSRLMLRTSYRTTVVLGGAAVVAGCLMLICLEPARGPLWAAIGGFIVGVGMGLANTAFTVSVQDSVAWNQRGIATSNLAFARMLGQSLGAALFGGVLNVGLSSRLANGSELVNRLLDPALRHTLPVAEIAPLSEAIAAALHEVYLIQGVFALILLLTALALPAGLSPLHPAGGQKRHGST
jgi:EmrB/QacA subfamily drug resistance transporter